MYQTELLNIEVSIPITVWDYNNLLYLSQYLLNSIAHSLKQIGKCLKSTSVHEKTSCSSYMEDIINYLLIQWFRSVALESVLEALQNV